MAPSVGSSNSAPTVDAGGDVPTGDDGSARARAGRVRGVAVMTGSEEAAFVPSPYTVTARGTAKITDLSALADQVACCMSEPRTTSQPADAPLEREWTSGRVPAPPSSTALRSRSTIPRRCSRRRSTSPTSGRRDSTSTSTGSVEVTNDPGAGEASPRYAVEFTVADCEVTSPRSAASWIGAVKDRTSTTVKARVAVRLLETIAGAHVDLTSLVAEPDDLEPGHVLDVPEFEITLASGAPVDDRNLAPLDERVVVTDGGGKLEINDDGRLANPPGGYPTDPSLRRPLRFDEATARRFVHFLHPIPIGRGFFRTWVLDNAPGWDGNDLIAAIRSAGLIERPPSAGMPRLTDGVLWVDIEPSGIVSRVAFDPETFRRGRP